MLKVVRDSILQEISMLKSQSLKAVTKDSFGPIQFVRGKRTKSKDALSPTTQRAITQLSVLSAARKQPRRLKICQEDYIKHIVVTKAWSLLVKQQEAARQHNLQEQYTIIKHANQDLKKTSPQLYEQANSVEKSKRFALEMRVPSEFPPSKVWFHEYDPNSSETKK